MIMDNRLSKETLKAHNIAGSTVVEHKPEPSVVTVPRRPFRDRASTMQSEAGSSTSGMGKFKLMKLRHKIRLFGGSFSKAGSETHMVKHYENTYRTEPTEDNRFSTKKAEDIIRGVLEGYLRGKTYDPRKFPNLCKSLAELIKERVKGTGCQRYKIIAHVMIIEKQGQSMRHVSRCLWNKEYDNYATATYESKDFSAVGSVFATYYD